MLAVGRGAVRCWGSNAGRTLDSATGVVSGTPTTTGTDTVEVTATNEVHTDATTTAQITVNAGNDAPVADTYTTTEDAALTVPAPGVLGNDTDVENTPLTASWAPVRPTGRSR